MYILAPARVRMVSLIASSFEVGFANKSLQTGTRLLDAAVWAPGHLGAGRLGAGRLGATRVYNYEEIEAIFQLLF